MGRGIGARAEHKEDERREDQRIRERDNVDNIVQFWVCASRVGGMSRELSRCHPTAEHDHQTREQETCDALAAMDFEPAGRDQVNVRDEQKNPTGKDCAVNMDE